MGPGAVGGDPANVGIEASAHSRPPRGTVGYDFGTRAEALKEIVRVWELAYPDWKPPPAQESYSPFT